MAGGKQGVILSVRPRKYPDLPQQKRLREASERCGIKKGISRAELVEKMKTCIPQYFEQQKAQEGGAHPPSPGP